jgi:hypothetical protein
MAEMNLDDWPGWPGRKRSRCCRWVVLPRWKGLYGQPQLVAIFCLMRYEGWTYREAVVR